MRQTVALLASTMLASVSSSFVFAQDSNQTAGDDGFSLEEIVVTSQRRAQSVQDVPIAVTALSETGLRLAGVDDIKELTQLAPSMQASSSNSETQGTVIRIRGVGTQGNNPAFESAVGVFIDGVYRSRPGAALSELLDVERIEVLRGPQGTLFGRNTSAGAISVVTADPKFEPGGYVEATYGNYDQVDIRGSAWGSVSDKVAVRLSALMNQRDGLLLDTVSGDKINTKDRYTIKGQALYKSDDVKFRLIADYRKQDEDCCYSAIWAHRAGTAATIINLLSPGAQTIPADPYSRAAAVTAGQKSVQNAEDWGLSGELSWKMDNVELTSVTSYRDFQSYRAQDIDFTGADLLFNTRTDSIKTFTQELRLSGQKGRLDWIIGGFFSDEQIDLDGDVLLGTQYEAFINYRLGPLVAAFFGPGLGATNFSSLAQIMSGGAVAPGTGWAAGTGAIGDTYTTDNQSYAIFTHNVVKLTDQLDLILGLRWTKENKRGASDLNLDPANSPGCLAILPALNALPNLTLNDIGAVPGDLRRVKDTLASLGCLGIASPGFEYDLEQNDDAFSGTAGLSYRVDENMMVYGSYSHGFKAGGINLDRAGTILTLTGDNTDPDNFLDPRFPAEEVDAFEMGFKSTLAEGRAHVNLALFYEDLKNFQLNTFTGFSFIPESVEDAKSKGFELELQARPADGFDIFAGVTYAKTTYGDNITDISNILTNERGYRTGTSLLPEASALAGRTLTNAPRWVVTSGATYRHMVTDSLEGFIHMDMRYQSEINTGSDLDPEKVQKGFALVNARIGLEDVEAGWSLEFWARNLLDKDYLQIAFDIPLQSDDGYGGFLGEPRMYGATFRYNF